MSHLPNTQTKTQSAALFPRVRPSGAGSTCCRGAETDTCVSPRAGAGQVRGRCEAGPGRCTEGFFCDGSRPGTRLRKAARDEAVGCHRDVTLGCSKTT